MLVSVNSSDARAAKPSAQRSSTPFCVNLDETLVLTNLLLESLLLLIKQNPLFLLLFPLWLLCGSAIFKAEVASRVALDPTSLPYDSELVGWLKAERTAGRTIWLCADWNKPLATRIAQHLRLFDGVLENTWADSPRMAQQIARSVPTLEVSRPRSGRLRPLFRALRPHQWAKNALVVVPLLAAHYLDSLSAVLITLLAMVAFCLCASSVYVLNDLLDLQADRANPRKCKRPFAAGHLPLAWGFILAPVLLGLAFGIAAILPASFVVVLGGYYALTLAYSLVLKGHVLVDALVLACLYTLRIVAGAAAIEVPLSFWMLLFSVFLFLSLAFVKRFAELDTLRKRNQLQTIGRGYEVKDLPILQSLGCASGYLSVLVLALYVDSPEIKALYRHPKIIWALCVLLLFWISRVWMTAQRGAMHDDPVVFALKDRASISVGLLAMLIVMLSI